MPIPAIAAVQAPAPPATPASSPPDPGPLGTPGDPSVYVVQSPGAPPMVQREVQALRSRRGEISKQLESASSRREKLAEELEGLDGASRAGIVDRIALLDKRILALESELETTGRQLASAPAGLAAASVESSGPFDGMNMDSDTVTAIGTTFTIFVLAPIAVAAARLMWKRGSLAPHPASNAEGSQRLDRIEQAVDAIAIEVERVSEGQRFMTRLLAEGHQFPGIGDGARVPEGVPASRSQSGER